MTNLGALFRDHQVTEQTARVHMNGRVYDPSIGRMTSADPRIPDISNSQALGRYTYVYNQPLSMVDPTGFDGAGSSEAGLSCSGGFANTGSHLPTKLDGGGAGASVECPNGDPSENSPQSGGDGGGGGCGPSAGVCLGTVSVTCNPSVSVACMNLLSTEIAGAMENYFNSATFNTIPGMPGIQKPQAIPVPSVKAPDQPQSQKQSPPAALCKALSITSGAMGGAVGGGTFALLTGNPEAILPAAGAGFVIGGVATAIAPNGGVSGLIAGGVASLATHADAGLNVSSGIGAAGDGVNSSIPPGAASIPVGTAVGTVYGAAAGGGIISGGGALAGTGAGAFGGGLVGGTAGGLSAAAALATTAFLNSVFSEATGCTF